MLFGKAKSDADFATFSVAENAGSTVASAENATSSVSKSASDFDQVLVCP